MNRLKKYILLRLFLWWINKDGGRELRGRACAAKDSYIEEILMKLSK